MAGHSHWAGIKHKKAITDAKRASVFTKMANRITVAAREGGDPDMNVRLRLAIDTARAANVPKDNIERAIKRGTGELTDGAAIEELVYEAYGPGQVAMLIGTATDNRNRTYGDIRTILTKNGGKIVSEGSVSYLFEAQGEITVPIGSRDPEEAELSMIEASAVDVIREHEMLVVHTAPDMLKAVRDAVEAADFTIRSASIERIPSQKKTKIDAGTKKRYDTLLEVLDDHPDVQTVWDNLG